MRSVSFAQRTFSYLRCAGCRSLVCDPMPDDDILSAMYGPGYAALTRADYQVDSPRDTTEVVSFLNDRPPGTIIDFGCGDGDLVRAIQRDTSWTPLGVEFDPEVAGSTERATGARIFTYADVVQGRVVPADALHLGDVLEHLTDLDHQMPVLLGLLRPGGHLLAEGPLEGGPALFELTIQATQATRSSRPVSAPPTHVVQATVAGQRGFFARHGLAEDSFAVYEVAWPAPSRLRRADLSHPRTIALYALRRLSQAVSRLTRWGNRYRYVGSAP
jgi:SAM-dependent methyltransferase